jgi:hypothetical protein
VSATDSLSAHCRIVRKRLADGKVIPFLGAGASLVGRPAQCYTHFYSDPHRDADCDGDTHPDADPYQDGDSYPDAQSDANCDASVLS